MTERFVISGWGNIRRPSGTYKHHFSHHGFKQIVFLAGPETNIDSNNRYFGFHLGLAACGFDHTFFSQYIHPSHTTLRQPILEMGSQVMEKLIQLIEGYPLASPHVILPAPLIIRESGGC